MCMQLLVSITVHFTSDSTYVAPDLPKHVSKSCRLGEGGVQAGIHKHICCSYLAPHSLFPASHPQRHHESYPPDIPSLSKLSSLTAGYQNPLPFSKTVLARHEAKGSPVIPNESEQKHHPSPLTSRHHAPKVHSPRSLIHVPKATCQNTEHRNKIRLLRPRPGRQREPVHRLREEPTQRLSETSGPFPLDGRH